MITKKKKGLHPKNVMRSGVSPQKLRKYRWQTPIWASICTTVAPSLLISSGHSSRLGRHNFCLGARAAIWGARPRNAPPRGARPAFRYVFIRRLKKIGKAVTAYSNCDLMLTKQYCIPMQFVCLYVKTILLNIHSRKCMQLIIFF